MSYFVELDMCQLVFSLKYVNQIIYNLYSAVHYGIVQYSRQYNLYPQGQHHRKQT